MDQPIADFEYLHLSDVDPDFSPKPVPKDVYTLQVLKIEQRTPKNGTGKPYFNASYAIVDGKFNGRKLFESYFANSFDFKKLRKLSDVTGVQQKPSEAFESWVGRISEVQPTFRIPVDVVVKTFNEKTVDPTTGNTTYNKVIVKDDSGKEVPVNQLTWRDAQPAI